MRAAEQYLSAQGSRGLRTQVALPLVTETGNGPSAQPSRFYRSIRQALAASTDAVEGASKKKHRRAAKKVDGKSAASMIRDPNAAGTKKLVATASVLEN